MFVWTLNPWFLRGSALHGGNGSGEFAFNLHTGSVSVNHGFRIVLVI